MSFYLLLQLPEILAEISEIYSLIGNDTNFDFYYIIHIYKSDDCFN